MIDLGGTILVEIDQLYWVEKIEGDLCLRLFFHSGKEHIVQYDTEGECHVDYMMFKRGKEKQKEEAIDLEINR